MKHCVYMSPTTESEFKWLREQPESKDIPLGLFLKLAISAAKENTIKEREENGRKEI